MERAPAERGLLAGLPVAIKDLNPVAGVRTTYGSPIYADHVPDESDIAVLRIEAAGGVVLAKSNTPEFGAGGQTFNEVFGATRNPWNTSLTCAGSSGGAAVALATGQVWLAHGSDLGGSLRTPGAFCSVVGLRPSPGRVPRGPSDSGFNYLSVNGPMARNVADAALFLDVMAGLDPRDPLSWPAPSVPYREAVAAPAAPRRIAFSPDLGFMPVDPEVRDICARAMAHFEGMGVAVEEHAPDFSGAMETFHTFRAVLFVTDHAERMKAHRDKFKPEIVWNYEKGLALTAADVAQAEAGRAALFQRMAAFFSGVRPARLPDRGGAALFAGPALCGPDRRYRVRQLCGLDGPAMRGHGHLLARDQHPLRLHLGRAPRRAATGRPAARRGGAAAGGGAVRAGRRPPQPAAHRPEGPRLLERPPRQGRTSMESTLSA